MKKIFVLIIISSLIFFSLGCSAKSEIKFGEGEILKKSETGKEVLVEGKFEEYSQKNIKFYFSVDKNTKIVNIKGENSTYDSLNAGQHIEVWKQPNYLIQESYPPRTTASKIVITNNKNNIDQDLNRNKLKEFYIQGSYNEKLYKKQKQLAKEDKVYFTVINSKKELDDQIRKYTLKTPRQEYSLNYNQGFFNDKSIVLVYPTQGSSSLSFAVKEITKKNGMVNIIIDKYTPEVGTTDIVLHGLLVELNKNDYTSSNNIKISIKDITP